MFIQKRALALSLESFAIASVSGGTEHGSCARSIGRCPAAVDRANREPMKHLHRNPRALAPRRKNFGLPCAEELRKLGYSVTEHVGRYTDGSQADGVVAVMEDAPGPRLLIRTDMDALPVEEKTGLNYRIDTSIN